LATNGKRFLVINPALRRLHRHGEAALAAVAIHASFSALALDCFAPLAMTLEARQ
jgi:hypothetical protein